MAGKSILRLSKETPQSCAWCDRADEGAVFEQGLGGDAAPVQADAAEVVLLDAEDSFLELAGADGGGITGGAAADDDDVVVVSHG